MGRELDSLSSSLSPKLSHNPPLSPHHLPLTILSPPHVKQARLSSFVGALALGDLVKSTLGPKGMNKILHSTSTGEITVTNDGATILKSIALDNPAAKILVNISKVQDDEVGDGMPSTFFFWVILMEVRMLIELGMGNRYD